jgi:hypothetical protein
MKHCRRCGKKATGGRLGITANATWQTAKVI